MTETPDNPSVPTPPSVPAEPAFFMPDGNGGHLAAEEAETAYERVRAHAIVESHFADSPFTDRRVYRLVSEHQGSEYDQVVGEMTRDNRFVIAIFESPDDRGRSRFVVATASGVINVDASKVREVRYFAE